MDTPQEVEVWFVLPAIRRSLAQGLKDSGLMQKDIAKLMGLSEPAVSQYLKNKRGNDVKFPKDFEQSILQSARRIHNEKSGLQFEIQKLLRELKTTKYICEVCHEHAHTDEECDVCYVG